MIYNGLRNALIQYPDGLIIGEDIRDQNRPDEEIYGGAFKVTKGLSSEFDQNVVNSPIAEQMIVGYSLGYALNAGMAVAEIMFGDFLTLCLDQLLQHASKFKIMFGRDLKIPLIIRTPMGGKRGYGPTHSQSIEKHFLGIDGLEVYALNHRIDPRAIFTSILNRNTPTLLIENKILYTAKSSELPYSYSLDKKSLNFGYLNIKSTQKADLIVFCYSDALKTAEQLADLLLDEEIYIEIVCGVDLNSNLPEYDWKGISGKHVIVIEEGSNIASWSSIITLEILRQKIVPSSFASFSNNEIIPANLILELFKIPSADKIINYILDLE